MPTIPYATYYRIATNLRQPISDETREYAMNLHNVESQRPLHGRGSRGGGYVLICEGCNTMQFTMHKEQRYCMNCAKLLNSRRANSNKTEFPTGKLHRRCAACGKEFEIYTSDIKRGHGIYCSTECHKTHTGYKPVLYMCEWCNRTFRTTNPFDAKFCCDECHSRYFDSKTASKVEHYQNPPRIPIISQIEVHKLNTELYYYMKGNRSMGKYLYLGFPVSIKDRITVYNTIKNK